MSQAIRSGAQALIDAGGLVAGVNNHQAAKYLFDKMLYIKSDRLAVVFFDTGGKEEWRVCDAIGREWSLRSSPIREAQAFVFFDDRQCRGANMMFQRDARAMLTLGAKMVKDKPMHAGRMRELHAEKSLFFVGARDVTLQIYAANQLPYNAHVHESISSQYVLQWTLLNSVAAVAPESGLSKAISSASLKSPALCTTRCWS